MPTTFQLFVGMSGLSCPGEREQQLGGLSPHMAWPLACGGGM